LKPRGTDTKVACALDAPLDLIKTFGPMSAMHAAMDRRGVGMPCGLVARLQRRTIAEVEAAVATARRRFPVLERRIAWLGSRPMLVAVETSRRAQARASEISLAFKSDPVGPLWCYGVFQDGEDAWLMAIWVHAAADGHSMLRFVETISAALNDRPAPHFQDQPNRRTRRRSMARWLVRFLIERHLRYVRPREDGDHPPGVAWLTIPSDRGAWLLERARAECGSFAAWLAGAACMAFCEQQQGMLAGRVSLNLPILRNNREQGGGFGFGIGSLLMPVTLDARAALPLVARRIFERQSVMMDEGWDENFERFLGNSSRRHLRFAGLHALGMSAPTLSVSWKGVHSELGGEDGIRDLACFAVSPVTHVSAHIDRNGLSVSLASSQSAEARENLLRRLTVRLGGGAVERVLTFDGHALATVRDAGNRVGVVAAALAEVP
jgi:hypothetical protein